MAVLTDLNTKEISHRIKAIGLSSGAELVGFVSADRFDDAPRGHRPSDLLPDARSAIVLACGRKLNEDRNYVELVGRYYLLRFVAAKESVLILRQQSAKCVEKVASYLEDEGFKAVIEWCGWSTTLSFRRAAYEGGLGVFGKGGFVIHPKYGPLNILAAIATDAPLENATPLNLDLCKDCTKCIEACEKYGAITQNGFDTQKCRVFDVWDPKTRLRIYGPCNAECVNVCPIGK